MWREGEELGQAGEVGDGGVYLHDRLNCLSQYWQGKGRRGGSIVRRYSP